MKNESSKKEVTAIHTISDDMSVGYFGTQQDRFKQISQLGAPSKRFGSSLSGYESDRQWSESQVFLNDDLLGSKICSS